MRLVDDRTNALLPIARRTKTDNLNLNVYVVDNGS